VDESVETHIRLIVRRQESFVTNALIQHLVKRATKIAEKLGGILGRKLKHSLDGAEASSKLGVKN
jgi:hypothetical protein